MGVEDSTISEDLVRYLCKPNMFQSQLLVLVRTFMLAKII